MREAGTVLAGFDTTERSTEGVLWAAHEAARQGQALLIVHALAVPMGELTRVHLPGEVSVLDQLRERAQQEMDRLATRCGQDHPALRVRTSIHTGSPAAVLSEAAQHAKLLVLGPPSLGLRHHVLLGSTSSMLVRSSHLPVIVVRQGQALARVQRIVVGVDGSPNSTRAIEFAYDFASRHDADVTAVFAWNDLPTDALPPSGRWNTNWDDIITSCNRLLAESLAGWGERCPEVTTHRVVTTTQRPAEALFTAAEDAGMIVVGSHGRGPIRSMLLGSVSNTVLHYAPCSVAVVR